jgi:hypothetical protein
VKWFGKDWGAPVCDPGEHVAAPVTERCARCGDAIEHDDNGFTLPYVAGCGVPGALHYHHMCLLASVVPLTVHGLSEGLPWCGFTTEVPARWPLWHLWDTRLSRINCERCRMARSRRGT